MTRTATDNSALLTIGDHVGSWLVLERLSSGVSASVFAVRHGDGEAGVLKVARAGAPSDAGHVRFARERRLLAALDHPRIPSLLDHGQLGDGTPWFVSRRATARPVATLLEAGPPPDALAIEVAEQIGDALAHAHARGIVHRDCTPGNILYAPGAAHLIDFGIAAVDDDAGRTLDGALLGTVAYAAPEQLTGGTITPATDVYGLAACLFAVLAGVPPHAGRSAAEILTLRAAGGRRHLAPATDQAREAVDLIEYGLSEDPYARPTDVRAWSQLVGDALAELPAPLQGHFVVSTAATTVTHRADLAPRRGLRGLRSRLGVFVAAGVVAAAAALGATSLPSSDPAPGAAERVVRRAQDRLTFPADLTVATGSAGGPVRAFDPRDGTAVELMAPGSAPVPDWGRGRPRTAQGSSAHLTLVWASAGGQRARVAVMGRTGATVLECRGTERRAEPGCLRLAATVVRRDGSPATPSSAGRRLASALAPLQGRWLVRRTGPGPDDGLGRRAAALRTAASAVAAQAEVAGWAWVSSVNTLVDDLRSTARAASAHRRARSTATWSDLLARSAALRRTTRALARLLPVPVPASLQAKRAPTRARDRVALATAATPTDQAALATRAAPQTGDAAGQAPAPSSQTRQRAPTPTTRAPQPDAQDAQEEPIVVGPAL